MILLGLRSFVLAIVSTLDLSTPAVLLPAINLRECKVFIERHSFADRIASDRLTFVTEKLMVISNMSVVLNSEFTKASDTELQIRVPSLSLQLDVQLSVLEHSDTHAPIEC